MQRKNNLLKSSRDGIALMMAMAVIVIIATIMALSLSLTTQTTKRTADLYVYEQVILLSKSAAEYGLLQISKNAPCSVTGLDFTHEGIYDVNITMKYIYTAPSPCANINDNYFTITTDEQNGSVLMDITVSVPTSKNIVNEPVRYFRRVIEKL